MGYLFGICVEKNAELDPSLRKFKGRVVFQGNQVYTCLLYLSDAADDLTRVYLGGTRRINTNNNIVNNHNTQFTVHIQS